MITNLSDYFSCLKYEPDRHLVGAKFIFSENEYHSLSFPEATHQLFFCMMVKVATCGKGMKVTKKHIYCDAAQKALGFLTPEKDLISGEIPYKRGMYCSVEVSKSIQDEIPYLQHKPFGLAIAPLEQFDIEPDVVISISTPYTAMRILQSYAYLYGYPKHLHMIGMSGICTELMAQAYKSQDINISFLCSNTRFSGNWRDDEVGISMPYSMFLKVKDAVTQTMNLYEWDQKKSEIEERAAKYHSDLNIKYDSNYYDSCLGVAPLGTVGYRKKIR